MSDWVRVAAKGDVAEGACLGVRVGDKEVAIYHLPGGEFCATENVCSHEYALLSDGWLENGCIECPLHAAQFDVRTGKAMSAPADENIAVLSDQGRGRRFAGAGPRMNVRIVARWADFMLKQGREAHDSGSDRLRRPPDRSGYFRR